MAKRKRNTSWFPLLLLALAAVVPAYCWWDYSRLGPLTEETNVLIKKGTTVRQASEILRRQGVVRNKKLFELWARFGNVKLMRGEYLFPPGISMKSVTRMLTKGEIHITKILITPSIHAWSLQKRMEPFIPEEVFWSLWESQKLKEIAGFPDAPTLEGLIAPATYHLNRAMEPNEIMHEMVRAFRTQVYPALEGGVLPPYETLVLASLAEKETSVTTELPHVAGVFYNRLKKNMRLQCDPTSLYARWLGGDLRFTPPLREDTDRSHPYNTYSVMGLPPGPIAIPSMAAIEAAKAPLKTDDYYFVATGTGGHRFSRTLQEHNRNVNIYRAEIAKQRAGKKPTVTPKRQTRKKATPQTRKKAA